MEPSHDFSEAALAVDMLDDDRGHEDSRQDTRRPWFRIPSTAAALSFQGMQGKVCTMPPEYLLQFVQRRPFEPFRICLDDGTVYDIRHPELAMPGSRAIIVGVPKAPSQPLFDCFVTLALLHVTRLEPLEKATVVSGGNGQ